MDAHTFARQFGSLYREIYERAVQRVADPRDRLAAETVALLLHLAQLGPATLSELTRHLGRSLSTLSAKVAALESDGLVSRQRDADDARKSMIWLSPTGQRRLAQALEVLDGERLSVAAGSWDAARRQHLIDELSALMNALPPLESKGDFAP